MKKELIKFSLIFGLLLIIFISVSESVFAQTPTTGTSLTTSISPTLTITPKTGQNQQDRITTLKTRAGGEIDRRVTAMNNLITKLNNMKRLSADQKSSFITQIQAETTSLNTLKTKIDADTDSVTLKTDVQSIVSSYRVFALFMPQIAVMTTADKMLTTIDQITPLLTKLQTRIQEAQAKGENITTLQTLFTDLQGKLNDAKIQANNAITAVTPLTPTGYPGNKTTLQSARTLLQAAYQDLKTVRKDTENIIKELKLEKGMTPGSAATTIIPNSTIISPTNTIPTK